MQKLLQALFRPVSADRLAWFRILFGGLMVWEAWHYLADGWVKRYFVDPTFHFTYYGFDWIGPLPGNGMYVLFIALGLLGLAVAFGWCYRLSIALFTAGFLYVFLIDGAFYLNHWYLIVLIAFMMTLVRTPFFGATVPAWNPWLLRGQILLVYFFAGIAKLDGDWLRGVPMADYLASLTHVPVIGPLLDEPWTPVLFSYGGLFIDLLVGPALLWRRTRVYALIVSAMFHLLNSVLFSIGVFPWLMLAVTFTLFWPDRYEAEKEQPSGDVRPAPLTRHQRLVVVFLIVWATVQVCLPLRHFFYPGNANWTNEGHRFAWRMMLRVKHSRIRIYVIDPRTETAQEVAFTSILTSKQYTEMADRSDMILQFAHYVADRFERETGVRPKVHVIAESKLNDRPPQLLIDPSVDLAAQPIGLRPASWILPLADHAAAK